MPRQTWSLRSAALAFGLVLALPARAQAVLVDLNQTAPFAGSYAPTSNPHLLTPAGTRCFFVATDDTHGMEPWVTDGTATGTRLLRDISPGPASSSPDQLTVMGGRLFFVATEPALGPELWTSDGTWAGTSLVLDLVPGRSGAIASLCAAGNQLFFVAPDPAQPTNQELWVSDGSAAGTRMVVALSSGFTSALPSQLTPWGGHVYFVANDELGGQRLWRSDGSAQGTTALTGGANGPAVDRPVALTPAGNTMFFLAGGNGGAGALWRTDGTSAGTTLVAPLLLPATSTVTLTPGNGEVYFAARDAQNGTELWHSDGTAPGTAMVRDILAGVGDSSPDAMCLVQGVLYFAADDGTTGRELWRSNGTAQGTTRVKDIWPGTGGSRPSQFVATGAALFFVAADPVAGTELWTTNGTDLGTRLVGDVCPGVNGSYPEYLVPMAGALLFAAFSPTAGAELWRSDGATATQVLDVHAPATDSGPAQMALVGNRLFFSADDGVRGFELWSTDGTAAGTRLVTDLGPGRNRRFTSHLLDLDGSLMFSAYSDTAPGITGIYRSDGTAAGTARVTWMPGSFLTAIDHKVFFVPLTTSAQVEPWITDGTAAGSRQLLDINPSGGSMGNWDVTVVKPVARSGGAVFFRAFDGSHTQLWRTDGTTAGTVRVSPQTFDGGYGITELTDVNGVLYFCGDDGVSGAELWRSDGTQAGTVLLRDIAPGWHSLPRSLVDAAGTLYFCAIDWAPGNYTYDLWKSDGTANGTVRVKKLADYGLGHPRLCAAGRRVFFRGYDEQHGFELWVSDGTAANTAMVVDLVPGPGSGMPLNYSQIFDWGNYAPAEAKAVGNGGCVVFAATDGITGVELWRSDGTAAGTRRLTDLAPGAGNANPEWMARVGEQLLFSATDDGGPAGVGRELYTLPVAAVGAALVQPIGQGCPGTNGRVPVCAAQAPVVGGLDFRVTLARANADSLAILFLSPTPSSYPLGGGCTLYLDFPLTSLPMTTDGSGAAAATARLGPEHAGATVQWQWIVLDPQGALGGLASLSNAVRTLIGD